MRKKVDRAYIKAIREFFESISRMSQPFFKDSTEFRWHAHVSSTGVRTKLGYALT